MTARAATHVLLALLLAGGAVRARGQPAQVENQIYLFPSTLAGLDGFLRITNHSNWAGNVQIQPISETGQRHPALTLAVAARATGHFNTHDLEQGNVSKGLIGSAGTSSGGHWRLVLTSNLDIDVTAYMRAADGSLTSLHDTVPKVGNHHRVTIFNPASSVNQRSLLRLVNVSEESAIVTITGTDDTGVSPSGSAARVGIDAGETATLPSQDLEYELGDGSGRWQLDISSTAPLAVMSLLEGPSGQLTNLSTAAPRWQPALVEDHFEETRVLSPARGMTAVVSAVVDAGGFETGTHGQRITDIYTQNLANSESVRLVQIDGWCEYLLHGVRLLGTNACGFIRHALHYPGTTDGTPTAVFWTASDQSPLYEPGRSGWFTVGGRPFTVGARAFARWARRLNVLVISSLENTTVRVIDGGGHEPDYCDDYNGGADGWIPLCGELDDYIAHSGAGLDKVVFVGAIDDFDLGTGAIRADGVFAPHTIYVESADGSTSQATPVLAAYATNLAVANPSWDAARLKRELFEVAREETLDYWTGRSNARGTVVTEERIVRVIRPEFAP